MILFLLSLAENNFYFIPAWPIDLWLYLPTRLFRNKGAIVNQDGSEVSVLIT